MRLRELMAARLAAMGPEPKLANSSPCKHCPTAHFPPDPESALIKSGVKSGELRAEDHVFRCAWNMSRLCRGVCDSLGFVPEGER